MQSEKIPPERMAEYRDFIARCDELSTHFPGSTIKGDSLAIFSELAKSLLLYIDHLEKELSTKKM